MTKLSENLLHCNENKSNVLDPDRLITMNNSKYREEDGQTIYVNSMQITSTNVSHCWARFKTNSWMYLSRHLNGGRLSSNEKKKEEKIKLYGKPIGKQCGKCWKEVNMGIKKQQRHCASHIHIVHTIPLGHIDQIITMLIRVAHTFFHVRFFCAIQSFRSISRSLHQQNSNESTDFLLCSLMLHASNLRSVQRKIMIHWH